MKLKAFLVLVTALLPLLSIAAEKPPAAESGHRQGLTLYVSKLGDNSDGRSWRTASRSTWGTVRMAMFTGSMKEFFTSYSPDGAPTIRVNAR